MFPQGLQLLIAFHESDVVGTLVTVYTTCSAFCPHSQSIHVFRMIFMINSVYFPEQYQPVALSDENTANFL
jgi:hypothetical protein